MPQGRGKNGSIWIVNLEKVIKLLLNEDLKEVRELDKQISGRRAESGQECTW